MRRGWDGDISLDDITASQSDMNIVNVMLWMKKEGKTNDAVA
jgi:hypothetical protein